MALRRLAEPDLALILGWRNAPSVRACMFSQHDITFAEHQAWFERVKDDSRSRWFIWEDADGIPRGTANFVDIRPAVGAAFWGFYCAPDAPRGTGTQMCSEALDTAFGSLQLHKVNAEVLASNVKSLHLHRKLGFRQEGLFRDGHRQAGNYEDVVRFGLLSHEWRQGAAPQTE